MKTVIASVAVLALVGCAPLKPYNPFPQAQTAPADYSELVIISRGLSYVDCARKDSTIGYLDRQLIVRGIKGSSPEKLSEDEQSYNALTKDIIWRLRINCANPDRFNRS
jgi:hypothetical protein